MITLLLLLACPDPPKPPEPPEETDDSDETDVPPPVVYGGLVLSEVMTQNNSAWQDPDAGCVEHDDWVELYNGDAEPVDLAGWTLGTARDGSDAWALPALTLEPGALLVVLADDDPEQGPLHAPFKLSAEGEEVWLWSPDGEVADHLAFPAMAPNASWGRLPDGALGPQSTPTPGAPNASWPDDPCLQPPAGFDDHSYPCIGEVESFHALSRARTGLRTVKFDILSFSDPAARHMVFLDTAFYELHDEWYIFRMLNGQPVEGEELFEPYAGTFADIDAIYAWADTVELAALFDPEFITRAGLRITAPHYYDLGLSTDPRVIGIGVLVYVPPDEVGEDPVWAFELEYSDTVNADEIAVYFEAIAAATPPEIGDNLRWLVRSPAQERTAVTMETGQLPHHEQIMRYAELTRPGEVEVYHPGLAAGRVRMVRAGEEGLDKATSDDILVLGAVPDELPPGAALLTAVPQTPLAHVALLAESRGIPNAYVAGVTEDPGWDQLARVRAWVAMSATADGVVQVKALTNPQIAEWSRLRVIPDPYMAPVDLTGVPLTVDLQATPADDMDLLRPTIGGKCAGMLVLLDQGVELPDAPLCVTVRAYADTLAGLDWLPDLLDHPIFDRPGDPRARYLVLEGAETYLQRYSGPADVAYLAEVDLLHPPGDRFGDLARGVGLRGAFLSTPVPPAVLDPILAELTARYAHLAPSQGLRFRSSSNIEDIEGFNGAGLYASYSGWLTPPTPDATVERALQQVWGSYWGAEAFEERHAAGIDHLVGGMGVLVHPRFEDEAEETNGVITISRLPDGHAERWEMVVNAQVGAISVTNPTLDETCRTILPEVARVLQAEAGAPRVERTQPSTETTGQVLDDAQLLGLLETLKPVVERWRGIENAWLLPEQHRTTLTLDLEFRGVYPGWPAMADGSVRPARLVLKQSRTLERSASHLSNDVLAMAYPRDLVARARVIQTINCSADAFDLRTEQAFTDPLARPDFGYTGAPFLASPQVWVSRDVPAVGWRDGDSVYATWQQLDPLWPVTASNWAVDVGYDATVPTFGGGRLTFEADGAWSFSDGVRTANGAAGTCTVLTRWSSPETWLEGVLDGG